MLLLLPLALTIVTLVAVARAVAQAAEEADQLRMVLARVGTLGPEAVAIGDGARRLGHSLTRLRR